MTKRIKKSGGGDFKRFDLPGNTTLRVKRLGKFKTALLKIFITSNLGRGATKFALLPGILGRGSRNFPTMTDITRHLEELYGAQFGLDVIKVGDWQVLQIRMEVLSNRYQIHRGNLFADALDFVNEILLNPLLENTAFKRSFVEQEKANLAHYIGNLVNDKPAYAVEMMFKSMCAGEPYSIYEYGRMEDIPAITPADLLDFHLKLLRDNPILVYVAGDVFVSRSAELAMERLKLRGGARPLHPQIIRPAPSRVKRLSEKMDVSQNHLVMGFRTSTPYYDPCYVPMAFASGILGGFPHSKLFKQMRDERALVYSVYSSLVRTKGIMYVYAGLDGNRLGEAEEIVIKSLEDLKRGKFTREEFDATRKALLSGLRSVSDSPGGEIDSDFIRALTGRGMTVREMTAAVRKVAAADVAAAAKRIKLDTVFTLKSGKNAGKNH